MSHTSYVSVEPTWRREALLEALRDPAAVLRAGGTVAFPTETVYGLGANALDPVAVARIFSAKGRPSDNPLIVHIAHIDQLVPLVRELPGDVHELARVFWPGPLTLVLPKSDLVPDIVSAGLDTVGVRMPSHPVASALIEAAGVPVAAPSANASGRPSPTTADHVRHDLEGRIDMIVDGGASGIGIESTVLELPQHGAPTVLRPGGVSIERLKAVIPDVRALDAFGGTDDVVAPRSPGLKHRHYSPSAPLWLFIGDHSAQLEAMIARADAILSEAHGKLGMLISDETAATLENSRPDLFAAAVATGIAADGGADGAADGAVAAADVTADAVAIARVGSRERLEEVASLLFLRMRELDQAGVNVILAESYPSSGIGLAIMNRLVRAAGGRCVFVQHQCRK